MNRTELVMRGVIQEGPTSVEVAVLLEEVGTPFQTVVTILILYLAARGGRGGPMRGRGRGRGA